MDWNIKVRRFQHDSKFQARSSKGIAYRTIKGELVTNFLSSNVSPKEYINSINSQLYNGFNLITGRIGGEFWYLGNKGGPSGDGGMMKLAENTPYGISNGILADFYGRDWPKVEYGKRLFSSILQKVCFALISRALKVNNCSENY